MKKSLIALSIFITPALVFAQDATSILEDISKIFNTIIPMLITLGIIYFIWNLIQLLMAKSDEVKKEAKDRMLWAVLIFFVILSIWGLVGIIQRTFGINASGSISTEEIPHVE